MFRPIATIIMAMSLMVGFAPVAFAQSEGYSGPQGFEWINPKPSSCYPINKGALTVGSESTSTIESQEYYAVLQIPNPDPTWRQNSDGESITQLVIIFSPGTRWTSNILTSGHIWYMSDGCEEDMKIFTDFLWSLLYDLEAQGEIPEHYLVHDRDNRWIQQIFSRIE